MSHSSPLLSTERRHDIDWLRTIALFLLIIYHSAISFQGWGHLIGFPQNEDSLESLWIPLRALNIWRIPILFLVGGMGVRFAMNRRSIGALVKERSLRILVPLLFGILIIGPINAFLSLNFYQQPIIYYPNTSHLWFLGNLFLYTLLILPLVPPIKKYAANRNSKENSPRLWCLLLIAIFVLLLVLEGLFLRPQYYSLFANTWHGWWTGLISFAAGFTFVSFGSALRQSLQKLCHLSLILAGGLFFYRIAAPTPDPDRVLLIALESASWMLAALGFSSRYLDHPSRILSYLSPRVFPVYILHLPIQFALSFTFFPLSLPPFLKFILLTVVTLLLCFAFTYAIERVPFLRPLFGLKWKSKKLPSPPSQPNLPA